MTDRYAPIRDGRGARAAAAGSHHTVNTARPPGITVTERRECADYRPTEPCHVTVTTEAGPVPGLLLQWRKPSQLPWEGYVAVTRPVGGAWVLVRDWIPAGAITRV